MANNSELKNLKNTVMVDNEEYNINAFRADHATHATNADIAEEAKQVQSSLTINCIGLDGASKSQEQLIFNGEEEKTINIVAASGGRFEKRIKVPNNTNQTIDDEAVLNYHDILGVVIPKLLSTSTLYNWDPDKSTNKFTPNVKNGTISGIGIVQGPEIAINGNEGFATNNKLNGWLPAYLYICSDSPHNIYFGTSGSANAIKLSTDATTLTGTLNGEKISYGAFDIYRNKTAIENIVSSADAGKVDRSVETEKLVFTGVDAGREPLTAISIANSIEDLDNEFSDRLDNIITGSGVVNAATKDGEGANIRTNYYRSAGNTNTANMITISTSGPFGGSIGDIWIQYSN